MPDADEPDSPVPTGDHGRQPEPLDADEGEPEIEPFGPTPEDDQPDPSRSLGGGMPGSSGR